MSKHRCVYFEDGLDYACECGELAVLIGGELLPLEPRPAEIPLPISA